MSHDQTWLGAVARSSGFLYSGCTRWLRRSRTSAAPASTRYMVRVEHRYLPSSSRSLAKIAAGARST